MHCRFWRAARLFMMSSSSICPTHRTFSSVSSTAKPFMIWSRDDWDRKGELESKPRVRIEHVRPFGPSFIPSKPHRRVTQRILKRSRSTRITRWYRPSVPGDLFSPADTRLTFNALKAKPEARFLNDQILPGLFNFPSDMARIEAPVSSLNDPVVVTLYRDGYHQYFD